MPSRPTVAAILAFWLTTTALVTYRDLWPRLFASGPPPIAVDLEDEARQFTPVGWVVYRGDQKAGRLTTRIVHQDSDDTLLFTHHYTQVQFDFSSVRIVLPDLTNVTRMTRSGELREQSMQGQLVVQLVGRGGQTTSLGEARVKVEGRVVDGQFVGHCDLESPLFKVNRDLDPVAVPGGHALNPLQPVNRIANVRPGQRWLVREVNPLDEALGALFKQQLGNSGIALPEKKRELLIAEVGTEPQPLRWNGEDVPCWVIEYRGGDVRAKTWVRASDGKVLRQEAFGMGERIALERED